MVSTVNTSLETRIEGGMSLFSIDSRSILTPVSTRLSSSLYVTCDLVLKLNFYLVAPYGALDNEPDIVTSMHTKYALQYQRTAKKNREVGPGSKLGAG